MDNPLLDLFNYLLKSLGGSDGNLPGPADRDGFQFLVAQNRTGMASAPFMVKGKQYTIAR